MPRTSKCRWWGCPTGGDCAGDCISRIRLYSTPAALRSRELLSGIEATGPESNELQWVVGADASHGETGDLSDTEGSLQTDVPGTRHSMPRPRARRANHLASTWRKSIVGAATPADSLPGTSPVAGHGVAFGEYLNLSWLSASLGTIAGGPGSSLDNEESVRRATFSRRECKRRQVSQSDDAEDGA